MRLRKNTQHISTKYVKNQLVSIRLIKETPDHDYLYVPERKTWWGKIIPAYFKNKISSLLDVSVRRIEENDALRIDENNVVWIKPYVRLNFTNGDSKLKRFDTDDKALSYAKKMGESFTLI